MEIKPIEAFIYNKDKVDFKDVIAPPYDVIDDNYQDNLYKRSAYNIVRLILAKGDSRYEDSKKDFESWKESEILVKTKKPSIFYIVQKYKTENGKQIERKGFIARNKIEEFGKGKVFPHEFTMGGPKEDRLKLVEACKAFFSQIFMVYSDPDNLIEQNIKKISETKPYIDVTDDLGVQNLVWIVDDNNEIAEIQKMMEDKTLLIADGHHRYETSMNYSKRHPENENAKYVMSYFTNLCDENLVVYPTHRVITKNLDTKFVSDAVKKHYDVECIEFNDLNKQDKKDEFLSKIEASNKERITTGLYLKGENKFYILKLKEGEQNSIDAPDVLKKLDLTVLHKLIITNELGFSEEEQQSQNGIKYIKQEGEAFSMVENGSACALFVMAYPKMQDIKDISSAGYKMPQKSTYFYPKLLSGIVINPLAD